MNPLAVEIWLYVLAAYLLVSFTLFVMARFSPYEWNNPHACHKATDVIENQFSVSNSFWFITGTFLRQGSGLNPKVNYFSSDLNYYFSTKATWFLHIPCSSVRQGILVCSFQLIFTKTELLRCDH